MAENTDPKVAAAVVHNAALAEAYAVFKDILRGTPDRLSLLTEARKALIARRLPTSTE